ncbi:SNARE protein, putative [Plasmodium berghei]|uniref:SNARE protein, putative n=2 Tax=Plasmodium berghei TaxID=5821 RepID=A0A509ARK8_PLABA|nr:SNARE protein, putative [Plasmodium berghei ANKA]CXI90636.1 SNARE protein, putative [Plasmodium berghei]SCL96285.1 SNARE protein, putative [Plasmodium berghei]SCM16398.1 SNARE protein, putative [Plasmodium berghei]SCM18192.1 SNARE protein, putative [Plasmodium berghei]SCN27620.1 SNARE protein, putative [Plasmodium berghei]|eukprot:XP_034423275.1 SNARE protein, putative [Plasmodium berghei ANKA]
MDIFFYSEEIDNLLEDYKKLLNEFQNKIKGNEKNNSIVNKYSDDINFIAERIKTAKDAYFIEIRNLPENEQNDYINKIKGKVLILENLNIQYEFLKNKLIYENKQDENKNNEINKLKYITPKELEIRGNLIQDQTEQSIFRMKNLIDESEQITKIAVVKLNEQNEKLKKVKDKVDDVDINVSTAKETLKEIMKEAASDRFIRLLFIMIFIVLVILISVIVFTNK